MNILTLLLIYMFKFALITSLVVTVAIVDIIGFAIILGIIVGILSIIFMMQ